MQISKINSNPMSFGTVKKSAVKIAVERAGNSLKALRKIESLIYEQENNDLYDVIENKNSYRDLCPYKVVKRKGGKVVNCCHTLKEACSCAQDKYDTLTLIKEDEKEAKCRALANKLIDMCEE